MDLDKIKKEYEEKYEIYDKLEEEAEYILGEVLVKSKIKIHLVLSRIKEPDSFRDKVERKQVKNPFKDITDIVGLRVICLFRSDIERIVNLIKKSFKVTSIDNKLEGDDSYFGYMAVHLVAEIKASNRGKRYDDIKKLPFEIQVTTLAMNSWSTISHYLDYKQEIDIPKELRRDFTALSALFYVADTQFEQLNKLRQKSRKSVTEAFKKRKPNLDQAINLDNLTAFLHKKFPKRSHTHSLYSMLLKDLKNAGINSLREIEEMYNKASDDLYKYEKSHPPDPGRIYSDVGAIRIILELCGIKLSIPVRLVGLDKN
ncbi:MAG: hypothetical protein GY839_12030 [candidate division Zixibacteria bacterium]|nr:hypothetical protein [candidate division Zixibacteria bacterium]